MTQNSKTKVIQVDESCIKFEYDEKDPTLFWEFCYRKCREEIVKHIFLNIQIPVVGLGIINQKFSLDKDAGRKLMHWLANALDINLPEEK